MRAWRLGVLSFGLWCLSLLGQQAYGQTLDEQFYPPKLQWQALENFKREKPSEQAPLLWQQGHFLRLQFDKTPPPTARVWLHGEGGLFVQARYTELKHEWLIERAQTSVQLILLEGFADAYPTAIYHSVEVSAPLLKSYSNPLYKNEKTVTVSGVAETDEQNLGIERRYHLLNQSTPFVQTLQGPGRYEFVFTTKWLAQYGGASLIELKASWPGAKATVEAIKIQPQNDYLLKTPWGEGVYSHQYTFAIELSEGEHEVSLLPDRALLGYWRSAQAQDSYLFSHNAKLKYAEKTSPPQEIPPLYFYRTLGVLNKADVAVVQSPFNTSVSQQSVTGVSAPQWLFTQVPGGEQLDLVLPNSSDNPPLRVMMEPGVGASAIVLIADSGERIELMRDSAYDLEQMPRHYVQFNKPYRQVTVKNLRKGVTAVNLAHKHLSPAGADEATFISAVAESGALQSLNWLLDKDSSMASSYLYQQELASLLTRLNGRYASFIERHKPQPLAGNLSALMGRLSQLLNREITTIPQWFEVMAEQGFSGTAERFLVATAMAPVSSLQQQAQDFMLTRWAASEKWYEIEGYWAYRFWQDRDVAIAAELGKVLLRQDKFELAVKWLYLAANAGFTVANNEAYIGAKAAGLTALSAYFAKDIERQPLPATWPYWQVPSNLSFAASGSGLLYNQNLQSYLEVLHISKGQSHRIGLAEAGRVRLTLYGSKSCDEPWRQNEQLILSITGQNEIYALGDLSDSLSMVSAINTQQCIAGGVSVVFELPENSGEFVVKTRHHDAYVVVEQLSDLIANWTENKGAESALSRQEPSAPLSQIELTSGVLNDPGYHWQRMQSVLASGGSKTLSFNRWQGVSKNTRWLEALLTERVKDGEYLIADNSVEVIQINADKRREITINIREIAQFGAELSEAKVTLEAQGKTSTLSLPYRGKMTLQPGMNFVRLALKNDEGFTLGKPSALNRRAWAFFSVDGYPLPPMKRRFDVATQAQPLEVLIPAQSTVRIDDAKGQSEVRYFAEQTVLSLTPKGDGTANSAQQLYRLWRWQPKSQTQTATQETIQPPPQVTFADHMSWQAPMPYSLKLMEYYSPQAQSKGSWGMSAGLFSRRNFDEAQSLQNERFYQLGWAYRRQIPQWQGYFSSDIALRRHRDTGLQTLAMQNGYVWEIDRQWSLDGELNLYYQYQADSPLVQDEIGALAKLGTTFKHDTGINSDNRLNLTLFGRYLSLSPQDLLGADDHEVAIDDDVYSRYKFDHRQGVELSDLWQYSPYRDTRIRASAALTSNSQFDLLSPARMRFGLGLRQYYEPLVVRLDYSHLRFRSENGQGGYDSSSRDALRFGLLFEHWRPLGQLAQVELFANRDLASGDTAFGIEFHWFITAGQGYDDFAPSRLAFSALRKRLSHRKVKSNEVLREGDE